MSSLDNFKNIADDRLEKIKVSENLKEATLQRCKKGSYFKRNLMTSGAAIGAVAVLVMFILNPSLLFLSRNKNVQSPTTMMETAGGAGTGLSSNSGKGSVNKDPNSAVSNNGTTFSAAVGSTDSGEAQGCEPYGGSGKIIYRQGTIEEAKRYIGAGYKNPDYIPSGFKQSLVQVPVDMDKEGMDIMISYTNENKCFSITMRKGAASLDHFTGNKEVDINGARAQMNSGKLMADSTEVSPEYTQIRWLRSGVLYIVEGQISEEEAVKVARSMK